MGDIGILVSDKGSDVKDLKDIIFTSKYATAKLDTKNETSFRNIDFTFNSDPPEPVSPAIYRKTKVGSIPHGYDYWPSYWSLVEVLLPVGSFYEQVFQETGLVDKDGAFAEASFMVKADSTSINFFVRKYKEDVQTTDLTGLRLRIRLYVFVEDVGVEE